MANSEWRIVNGEWPPRAYVTAGRQVLLACNSWIRIAFVDSYGGQDEAEAPHYKLSVVGRAALMIFEKIIRSHGPWAFGLGSNAFRRFFAVAEGENA